MFNQAELAAEYLEVTGSTRRPKLSTSLNTTTVRRSDDWYAYFKNMDDVIEVDNRG